MVYCTPRRFPGCPTCPETESDHHLTNFIHRHRAVLAGTDFFTVEVLTWRGLVTWYVLFFLHLDSRKITMGGITEHPDEEWMQQMARNP